MIELFYWPTPNGRKIPLFLEEAGVDYRVTRIDIGKGDQFKPDYLKIAPNNRMPAIIDHAPADGGAPISVFESGAILQYLAEKIGKFLPADVRGRTECMEWLFWQMAGLGPMTGQYGHFHVYAPEQIPYAKERYAREVGRLLGVLDRRLVGRKYICGDEYTIADMACWPWIDAYQKAPFDLTPYAEVRRWRASVAARPATVRAEVVGELREKNTTMSDEERKILFGQGGKA
ncbi:MAG: glutathione S-transferase N-terminal domain-containing protein [Rudaea sp.]|uniref:glutathione binding-like protein n=1 Tax=unclassified Rudaea TaxID=2627037 RepID=UPI0010F89752|nr:MULTISPECIES: glutathione binding-like protein [unclassified Rudaea]MBN8885309.1 glutathione S-transferase N-terminal domain-containing protein [Rudaea sp.]MBR0345714.1 glutathione S-transferase N-terminal domain-containing protein [Rudaea sp.]